MYQNSSPIGVFDSGVGGISVLSELKKQMPSEHFIYYGDNRNAPYGSKTEEEITKLTKNAFSFLASKNIKAIVLACNTATAVAVDTLRKEHPDFIIIGVEPAIKPAALFKKNGRVLLMATPVTVKQQRVLHLTESLSNEATFSMLPCEGLVELIEEGITEGPLLYDLLERLLKDDLADPPDAVVLGCTHYPFVKDALQQLFPSDVCFFDGAEGTSKQLFHRLQEKNLLNLQKENGKVEFISSDEKKKPIMEKLFYEKNPL